MKKKVLTGINIQYPISRLIIDGKKTIETRTYGIPDHLVGKELAIIETPGKKGNFKARVIGTIVFDGSFLYKSEASFYRDINSHYVTKDSPWKWQQGKPKWGWIISKVTILERPTSPPKKKGIVYTKNVTI